VNKLPTTLTFTAESSQRLDRYLVTCLPKYSRSRLQQLIKNGNVLVDGEVILKTGYRLENDMHIEIQLPPIEKSTLIPEKIPLDIVFENEDILVVNKSAGMVVHPGAGHAVGTLVHAVLAHVPNIEGIGGVQRPGIVHRLDKDTSGIIVLAKNDRAHQWLQDQFRDRQVQKTYLALVDGLPPTPKGRIEAAIGRDTSQRKKMAVTPPHKGREAISEYKTLENFDHHALLEVKILTGRTHQIRVHMAFIECPISGDRIYGRRHSTIPAKRHFLHAHELKIIIPGEATPRSFTAPLPEELDQIIATLRRS
jgi:23S rRNA pseudouridine1911/1915/1917 synthase